MRLHSWLLFSHPPSFILPLSPSSDSFCAFSPCFSYLSAFLSSSENPICPPLLVNSISVITVFFSYTSVFNFFSVLRRISLIVSPYLSLSSFWEAYFNSRNREGYLDGWNLIGGYFSHSGLVITLMCSKMWFRYGCFFSN